MNTPARVREILTVFHEVFPKSRFRITTTDDGDRIEAFVWTHDIIHGRRSWRADAVLQPDGGVGYMLFEHKPEGTGNHGFVFIPESARRSAGKHGAIGWSSLIRDRWLPPARQDIAGWYGQSGYFEMPFSYRFCEAHGWNGGADGIAATPWTIDLPVPDYGYMQVILMRPLDHKNPIALVRHAVSERVPPDAHIAKSRIEQMLAEQFFGYGSRNLPDSDGYNDWPLDP